MQTIEKHRYFDNANVWNAETGQSEPVFTGTGEKPPPESEGKNGWYAPRGTRTLIRCRTKETYSIDHSRLATYPENYRPLRPKPGTDDPGPMQED